MSRFTAVMVAVSSLALVAGTGTAFGQLGDGSTGTVQVTPPPVDIQIDAVDGTGAAASVATPGGDTQTATGSTGTVQAALPGANGSANASPSQEGTAVDPNASFSAGTSPATGGPQTADGSTGTAQIGGAGSQTATDSTGTVQVAQPGTQVDGSVQGPLRPDMPDGAVTPEADAAASVDPAQSGPQSADGSTGTVQVGGGSQTASDSTGSAQIAVPAIDSSAGAGGSPTSSPDGSVTVTPGGGPQTADGSTGTLQVGGGGSPAATDSTGTAQIGVPAIGGTVGGGSPGTGTFFSAGEATPLGTSAAPTTPAPAPAGTDDRPEAAQPLGAELNATPLGASTTSPNPLAATVLSSTLPFTGLELWLAVLLALALLGTGYALRRGTSTSVPTA